MTVLLEDPVAAHQIRLRTEGGSHDVLLSCTCRAVPAQGRPRYEVIERRHPFPAAAVIAAWRAWHEEQGVMLA